MKLNSVITGLLIGAGTILAGYGIITLLFEFMVSTGAMDEAGSEASSRQKTVWLLAVCLNIVGVQVFRKRKTHNTQRGISIITVLSAFGWFFYYNKSLLFLD